MSWNSFHTHMNGNFLFDLFLPVFFLLACCLIYNVQLLEKYKHKTTTTTNLACTSINAMHQCQRIIIIASFFPTGMDSELKFLIRITGETFFSLHSVFFFFCVLLVEFSFISCFSRVVVDAFNLLLCGSTASIFNGVSTASSNGSSPIFIVCEHERSQIRISSINNCIFVCAKRSVQLRVTLAMIRLCVFVKFDLDFSIIIFRFEIFLGAMNTEIAFRCLSVSLTAHRNESRYFMHVQSTCHN